MALSYHYVTVTGAGAKDGAAWASAFDLAAFMTDFGSVAAGDIYFFEAGNYSMTADITTATDGTATDPIAIIGVKAGTTHEGAAITGSDFGTGADRPSFSDGGSGYGIALDDYSVILNVIIDTRDLTPLRADVGGVIINCKITQSYEGASASYGVYLGGINGNSILNEITGDQCNNAIISTAINRNILFNYIHDITEAGSVGIMEGSGAGGTILFNIFDNLPEAIDKTADNGGCIFGNTFYDCDVGISQTSDYGYAIINNIFSECDNDAIIASTAGIKSGVLMYNHFYNNGDDYDGVIADGDAEDLFCDFWDTSGDPKFTAAGSDFSLASDSPCIDAGLAMTLGVG